jgi:hypothetical protein
MIVIYKILYVVISNVIIMKELSRYFIFLALNTWGCLKPDSQNQYHYNLCADGINLMQVQNILNRWYFCKFARIRYKSILHNILQWIFIKVSISKCATSKGKTWMPDQYLAITLIMIINDNFVIITAVIFPASLINKLINCFKCINNDITKLIFPNSSENN